MLPTDAVVAVTFRCNCRCAMCNIWRLTAGRELAPRAYRKLPPTLRDVNVTGGEPFLRDDLDEILDVVLAACPRARIIISTNGLMTNRIRHTMQKYAGRGRRVGLALSVDGIGELHDRIRGLPGAYEKALRTLELLQQDGVRGVRLAFTVTAENLQAMTAVYDLARERGMEFTCAVTHGSEHYFQTQDTGRSVSPSTLRAQAETIIERELNGFSLKHWGRAYFLNAMVDYNGGMGRPLPCRAGEATVFIDPAGDVFPCNAFNAKMGNLEDTDFPTLWRSPEAQGVRRRLTHCAHGCWMICSARPAMQRHKWTVLKWCLRRKFLGGKE